MGGDAAARSCGRPRRPPPPRRRSSRRRSAGAESVPSSPEMLSLIMSTPSRRQSRAMRRTSSGPSTATPKLSWCRCSWRPSPRPPVTVSSGLAASRRGPSITPWSMASRTATSRRILAAAAEQALVKPAPRSFRAASMVSSAWSSGGSSPSARAARRVDEGQMRMAFDHARHEEFAGRVEALGAVGCNSLGLRCNCRDPFALDKHFAGKRRRAGAVPDHGTLDQQAHRLLLDSLPAS